MSWKCVLLASQFKLSLPAVAGFVALSTHCQAIQFSAMMNFVILNRRTQPRIKNKAKSFFCSSRACACEFLDQALTMLCLLQAYLKHCCSLCEALVETKVHLLYSGTNKFAYASIECCIGGCKPLFFLLVHRFHVIIIMLYISWNVHLQALFS